MSVERCDVPEVMKKRSESPLIPMVPGPVLSARTLISENAPQMIPKPKPDTGTMISHNIKIEEFYFDTTGLLSL